MACGLEPETRRERQRYREGGSSANPRRRRGERRRAMIVLKRALAVAAVLGFTLGAMAAVKSNGVRVIRLTEPTMILGQKVEPGAYRLSWSGERGSDAVRVELKSENQSKVLASGKGLWR